MQGIFMDMEHMNGQMKGLMKVNGIETKCMDKGRQNGQMVDYILEVM